MFKNILQFLCVSVFVGIAGINAYANNSATDFNAITPQVGISIMGEYPSSQTQTNSFLETAQNLLESKSIKRYKQNLR